MLIVVTGVYILDFLAIVFQLEEPVCPSHLISCLQ